MSPEWLPQNIGVRAGAFFIAAISCACAEASTAEPAKPSGGYVVGNFGISAQITEEDGPTSWIKVNPPQLGTWLQNFARGELWVKEPGGAGRKLRLRATHVSRLFPRYQATFDAEGQLKVKLTVFAPLSLDSRVGFLPGLLMRAELRSDRPWSGVIGYTLTEAKPDRSANLDGYPAPWPATMSSFSGPHFAGASRGQAFIAAYARQIPQPRARSEADRLSIAMPVETESSSLRTVWFVAGSFDVDGYYANETPTTERLIAKLVSGFGSLESQLQAFETALPSVGDHQIDSDIRWYTSAGILLTKGDRARDIVTMGYRELNPRDSFWTSGMHLVFWPDLERKMIKEIAEGQRESGRIPTTVLPLIDRGDEIDSSEYFILRVARYERWYRDPEWLKTFWPAVKKAVDYLASRDEQQVGVPMQRSYWADWKDVPTVQGRQYAPHFALLWLASLEAAAQLASTVHDGASVKHYGELQERARAFINRPFAQGGMWDGTHYADRWADGHHPHYVLADQIVGAYFNVVPQERLEQIYRQLKGSETAWGVRETYPYAPYGSSFDPPYDRSGNYHNGGIWPYLNFVDAGGRYMHGHAEDAERIIREVSHADLEVHGDYQPGEFMNGNNGKRLGMTIQGWDAALFSAIYFGAFGLERTSVSNMDIHVHIPQARDFSTRLYLPLCSGTLTRKGGGITWEEEGDRCREQGLKVNGTDLSVYR